MRSLKPLPAMLLCTAITASALTVPVTTAHAGPPQGFAYVVNNLSNSVTTISVSTGGTATIAVGNGPTAVAISPDGAQAYVTNGRSNTVSVLDTESKRPVATVVVGARPSGVVFGPDGTRAYVTNFDSRTVSVIDTAQRRVIATIPTGTGPSGIAITPDGARVFVANNGSNNVTLISTGSNIKLADLSAGTRPTAVAVTPDGSKALVANNGSGDVAVFDVSSGTKIATITAGRGPSGIAITPDGTRAYVSNADSNDVTVLDASTDKVDSIDKITTVKVGAHPVGVAVSADGTKVYVPGNGSRKTSVIRTSDNDVTTSDVDSGPTAVATGRPQELSAIVSLGDSFISGVAGRWQGNGLRTGLLTDVHGTDRAVYACGDTPDSRCSSDPELVYGRFYNNADGCLRSYTSEIQSADIPVYRKINLACSGAQTENIIDQPLKGQAPQVDQLAALLPRYKVKMVVMTVGGNDLGFRDIITTCVEGFVLGAGPCEPSQTAGFNQALDDKAAYLDRAIVTVRSVMRAGGYPDGSYRFVLQSYPSPVPAGEDIRYPATFKQRFRVGGCPVYDSDATWVRRTVVPTISQWMKSGAHDRDVEFLDVANLFDGHEVCAKGAEQAGADNWHENPLLGNKAEWGRFLDGTTGLQQGDKDESVHPNYYGQRAMASCLTAVYDYDGGKHDHTCTNVPGKGAEHVELAHSH
ncbi:beta-propeller fold lactonase family protein [Umezawaea sp. Da 62-37]|uniref:beta-propeller fold lactonase family protein n=1 Tax=Umezawaea sp. Da 62-37 TaxID=3075927 RepID=UPI0028F6D04E|nr:beta-propeller fold lactonase family protein [Umezawaea sp. Da 62-37]WNV82976.1 beta-propeller fold lactonase family protein [Umezawaea sp. Da 62-37]